MVDVLNFDNDFLFLSLPMTVFYFTHKAMWSNQSKESLQQTICKNYVVQAIFFSLTFFIKEIPYFALNIKYASLISKKKS